jgi:hypothetical protein
MLIVMMELHVMDKKLVTLVLGSAFLVHLYLDAAETAYVKLAKTFSAATLTVPTAAVQSAKNYPPLSQGAMAHREITSRSKPFRMLSSQASPSTQPTLVPVLSRFTKKRVTMSDTSKTLLSGTRS